MPQIPQYKSQINPTGTGAGRGSSPADFGGQTADAAAQLGDLVTRLGEHMATAGNKGRVLKATARAQRRLQAYSFELQNGSTDEEGNYLPPPDPRDHEKLFDARAKQIDDDARKELGQGALYAEYEGQARQVYETEKLSLRKANIGLLQNKALADLAAGLDDLAITAADGDERARLGSFERANTAIETYERAGLLDPTDAHDRRIAFGRQIDMSDLRRDMRDPTTALRNLLGKEAYPNLDPAERQQWITTATNAVDAEAREKRAEEERADRDAEKALKFVQTETAKTGAELEASGRLTPRWVRDNRDNLDETDYRALLKASSGKGEGATNKRVYSDLRIRRARGEDVADEVLAAYAAGDITKTDFNALTTGTESADGPRAQQWYKDGESYINTTLFASELNGDASIIKQLKADILDRWRMWADAHPDAKGEDARREYLALAESARQIDTSKIMQTEPLPRFVKGERNSVTMKSLREGQLALDQAYERGEIDGFDYQQQLRDMRTWAELLRARQPTPTNRGQK